MIYENIKQYISDNMLDAFQVFAKAGLDRRQTKAILKGNQILTAKMFAEICKVLNVSADIFIN